MRAVPFVSPSSHGGRARYCSGSQSAGTVKVPWSPRQVRDGAPYPVHAEHAHLPVVISTHHVPVAVDDERPYGSTVLVVGSGECTVS